MTAAALGTILTLATFDGEQDVDVKAGTHSGTTVRLKGLGVGRLQRPGRGDLVGSPRCADANGTHRRSKRSCCASSPTARGEEMPEANLTPIGHGVFARLRDAFTGSLGERAGLRLPRTRPTPSVGSILSLTGAEARHAGDGPAPGGRRTDRPRRRRRTACQLPHRVGTTTVASRRSSRPSVLTTTPRSCWSRRSPRVAATSRRSRPRWNSASPRVMPWAADRSIVQWRGPKVDKALASWQSLCSPPRSRAAARSCHEVEPLATTRELAGRVSAATASGTRVLVLARGRNVTPGVAASGAMRASPCG